MVRFIIDPSIVNGIKRVKFAVFDEGSVALFTQYMTDFVPVEAFVGDHGSWMFEISGEVLPRDLFVLW